MYSAHTKFIFFFFHFSMFTFFIITENARNCFFMKYGYFNSILNATHSLRIHRAFLEKLRFEKKVKNILTSNISEIYEPIILPN